MGVFLSTVNSTVTSGNDQGTESEPQIEEKINLQDKESLAKKIPNLLTSHSVSREQLFQEISSYVSENQQDLRSFFDTSLQYLISTGMIEEDAEGVVKLSNFASKALSIFKF